MAVLIPLAKGFEEIEAVALIDVLRRGGLRVTTAGLESIMVEGAHGIVVCADTLLSEIEKEHFEMIVLPGGHQGMTALANDTRILQLLRTQREAGRPLGAICASPVVLAKAGVLGERYTCYPGYEREIGAGVYDPSAQVVMDTEVMTSSGPGTALCFALAIVRRLAGEESYTRIKKEMLTEFCS